MTEISSYEGQTRLRQMKEESERRLEQHTQLFAVSKFFDSDIHKIVKEIIKKEKMNVFIINQTIKKQSPNIKKIITERQNYIDRNRTDLALYVNLSYLRKQHRMNWLVIILSVITGVLAFLQLLAALHIL